MFTAPGCKDRGIRIFDFVTITQFLCRADIYVYGALTIILTL